MRSLLAVPVVMLAGLALAVSVGGCEQIAQALGTDTPEADASTTTDAAVTSDAGVLGGGCGQESNTGIVLCTATTLCPTVVVDTSAMPSCGFRIRGSVVDIVCGCNNFVCPMGTFATCTEAATILAQTTQQEICNQVATERCVQVETVPTTSSSSTSSTSSSGGTGCDPDCVKACGGGAACASICNCG